MQATARRLSVVSATSCARRRLIRNVRLNPKFIVTTSTKSILKSGWAIAFAVSLVLSIGLEVAAPGSGAILGWIFVALVFIAPAILMRELGFAPIRRWLAGLWCFSLYMVWVIVHAFMNPGQTPKPNLAMMGGLVLCWRLLQFVADSAPSPTAKPPPLPSSPQIDLHYFVSSAGNESGPFVLAQIRAMWSSGAITADSYYWQDGMAEWRPIAELFNRQA